MHPTVQAPLGFTFISPLAPAFLETGNTMVSIGRKMGLSTVRLLVLCAVFFSKPDDNQSMVGLFMVLPSIRAKLLLNPPNDY